MANTRNKVAIVFDGVVCRVRTPVRTALNKYPVHIALKKHCFRVFSCLSWLPP
ncbi:MAG: hypothetical protein FWH14_08665 [Oscillospiraceae bacterium]|nr:hypothetical protein [Oscillospiraceae bacterium]